MENAILLELFLELDASTPEGLRSELIDGEIVVSPPPEGYHAHCLSEIWRQVTLLSATRMSLSGHKGLAVPREGGRPPGHVIPDATIAPREGRPFRGAPAWMPCDDVAMVVEVTSSRADIDRITKRHCYARAGIPLYLLVDREHETVTLFSEPADEDYGDAHTTAFGKTLPLPEPFAFVLETSELG
ncbi:Uma2 family endonuclease [Streptomyces klenkii]|uniref:Uma2 family endonuclease n=1 Tax=Streptomyces klenkii TaxID=1420899 RepID=UPI00340B9E33